MNKTVFEKANITKWHKKGYTGKGVTVVVLDDSSMPHKWANVELPIDNHHDRVNHKTNVCSVVRECLPDVRIVALTWFKDKDLATDWLYKHKDEIDIINCSFSSPFKDDFTELESLNLPIICASGNDGRTSVNYPAELPWTIAVGAFEEYFDRVAGYSNKGKMLDCVAFTNLEIRNSKQKYFTFNGTSCSAPVVSSMLGIYIQWRKKRGLPKLTNEQAREFIHKNCIDYGEEGFDEVYGHGLFVLPDIFEDGDTQMNNPKYIIIHHSATTQGSAETFRKAHMAKGWRDVGYHYVIGNGTYSADGLIEPGRPEDMEGAHCIEQGMNRRSVGICLVGDFDQDKPTARQMDSLLPLARQLMAKYSIPPERVLGHRETGAATNCPGRNFDMKGLRKMLEDKPTTFTDVPANHWAKADIDTIAAAGIMAGYPDGRFGPDEPVTRAQLAAVINRIRK